MNISETPEIVGSPNTKGIQRVSVACVVSVFRFRYAVGAAGHNKYTCRSEPREFPVVPQRKKNAPDMVAQGH